MGIRDVIAGLKALVRIPDLQAVLNAMEDAEQADVANLQAQINAGGGIGNSRIVTAAGPVTAAANDGFIGIDKTTPEATTLTLTPTSNKLIVVKDIAGNAQAFPITVVAQGSTIDGQPQFVIKGNRASFQFFRNSVEWSVL